MHITGTLTTLGALLRRHEKFDRGGVKKLTGVQLPTKKEWRMHTEVEVRDIARCRGGGGGPVMQRCC